MLLFRLSILPSWAQGVDSFLTVQIDSKTTDLSRIHKWCIDKFPNESNIISQHGPSETWTVLQS